MRRLLRNLLFLLLAFVAGAVWADRDQLGGVPELAGVRGLSHSDLAIEKGPLGRLGGTIRVENGTPAEVRVVVRVKVYDGEDAVGSLLGEATVAPDTTSQVDLRSLDGYASHTDTDVELLPLPGG